MKGTVKKFDKSYDQFAREKDPALHRKALVSLLSNVELDEPFLELIDQKDEVDHFFTSFARAGEFATNPDEQKSLKQLGKLTKTYFAQKKYDKLSEIFCAIAFRNLVEALHLQERDDFEELTSRDLFLKKLLPPELMLPYFLLETFVQVPDFDWDRGEEIAHQNLACLVVCFGTLYTIFDELEDGVTNESAFLEAHGQQRVGRNDPCPCHSGMKWKKCCGSIEKPRCVLCGRFNNLIKTDCCGNLICDDEDDYVPFSYDRNSCSRNHRRFTLCGYHHMEKHAGEWTGCVVCRENFEHELEMYVWYGTNEYNFTKLQNPPTFTPTYCAKCGKHIKLPDGGYSSFCDVYLCEDCPISDDERNKIIDAYQQKKANTLTS
jgi:hypothetical protein